ncbi:unnamed protein product [Lactuca saligna]|uniref:Uncharacterized protein n=1 Tax=Lactuca saligna TaxID=75948 RepID=A0AA35XZT6_LACSI|nr:unnamed protein product [Lactuca saligna]
MFQENSFSQALGHIDLDLAEVPEKATRPPPQAVDPYSRFGPMPEISHIFRPQETLLSQQLSYAFLGLVFVQFMSFLVKLNMQEGLDGNPAVATMKNVSRAFAAFTVPLTITSNLFSLVYGLLIKKPSVKNFLHIPIIIPPPPSPASQSKPTFSFFEGLKNMSKKRKVEFCKLIDNYNTILRKRGTTWDM